MSRQNLDELVKACEIGPRIVLKRSFYIQVKGVWDVVQSSQLVQEQDLFLEICLRMIVVGKDRGKGS
jgi:hypothetical protein